MLTVLFVLSYLLGALGTKVHFKLNRWDNILPEEPYIIGAFWPVYWLWRVVTGLFKLVFRPFVIASSYLENRIEQAQKAKEEDKVRIKPRYDRDFQDAEDELEDFLNREERFQNEIQT